MSAQAAVSAFRPAGQAVIGWALAGLISLASIANAAGDPPLVNAAKDRDAASVRTQLAQQADVNGAAPDGATALHWAAQWDDLAIADLLIAAGANVNIANDYGVTPLITASVNGSPEMVRKLLKAGANANAKLPSGATVLMMAARTGNAEVVKSLLDSGADLEASEPAAGQTALLWAAAEDHPDAVNALLARGADVHGRSKAGYTPLVLAARSGDVELAKILLAAGADVNEAATDGTNALTVATIRGLKPLAEFLLDRKADPNKGPGFTPLHWVSGDWNTDPALSKVRTEDFEWAILQGMRGPLKVEFIRMLLAHGADVNARANRGPAVPRARPAGTGVPLPTADAPARPAGGARSVAAARGASRAENTRVVDQQADERQRLNTGTLTGATPFAFAAMAGDVPTMKLLLEAGADPLIATAQNTTPLMLAAGIGRRAGDSAVAEINAFEAARLCLELGIDVNAANEIGETALHGAAYRGQGGSDSIVRMLLDKGANINARNKRGWTPLIIAEGLYFEATNSKSPATVEILQKAGAEPSPPDIERDATAVDSDADNQ